MVALYCNISQYITLYGLVHYIALREEHFRVLYCIICLPPAPDPGWTYTGNLLRVGNSNAREFERVVDANYLGYTDRRWLVSRKRNDTLSDHVNRWRKHMLRVEVISAEELEFFDRTMDEWQ